MPLMMTTPETASVSLPLWSTPSRLRDALLVVAGSLLIAALAQIQIPLPFSPVPITLQTLGVFLVAGALGGKRGALSVALYVAEGAAGLPFFAGGLAGLAQLGGPRGGYLAGFVAAAAAIAWLLPRRGALLALVAGQIAIYALGVGWLSTFMGLKAAFIAGCLPFLVGDALKLAVAASTLALSSPARASK